MKEFQLIRRLIRRQSGYELLTINPVTKKSTITPIKVRGVLVTKQ